MNSRLMKHTNRTARVAKLRFQSMATMAVLTVVVLVANDRLLRSAMRANSISRVNWLFQSEARHYDLAILGSSLAKEGIDPQQLSKHTELDVVQLSWGGRGVAEQALYWELFLQRNTCSTLLLELHPRGLEVDAFPYPLDAFRYFQRLDDPAVYRHLSRHFGQLRTWLWRWIPMLGIAEFNTQIGWHDALALRHRERFDPNAMGDVQTVRTAQELHQQRAAAGYPGGRADDERSIEQIHEILQECEQLEIRVIAFYPPQFGGMTEADVQSLERYRMLIQQHFPELAVEYFTVANAKYAEEVDYYQDALHLNARGCQAYTGDFADFLMRQSR